MERTVAEYQRLLDRIILPAVGKKKVADVTRADISRLHQACRDAPSQANHVLAVLSKMFNAVLPNVRLHDLRHCFASIGAAGGDSLLVIGKLLGHSQVATTERYAHFVLDPIKAAAASIADRIASALEGANGNGEVVPPGR